MSRRRRPKQYWPIVSGRTLLEDAYALYRPLVASPQRLFLTVSAPLVAQVRRLLPRVPPANIIGEPVSRNTGPAVGLESAILRTRFPKEDPVVASVTCDDVFLRVRRYHEALRSAERLLVETPGAVVVVADRATSPDAGLTYLRVGRPLRRTRSVTLRPVEQVIEKPNPVRLAGIVRSAKVVAHTGQYLWRLSTVTGLLESHHPHLWKRLARIGQAWLTRSGTAVLRREYPKLPNASVEQLVAQVAPQLVAACGDFAWSDTGKWFLIHQLRAAGSKNVLAGQVVTVDTEGSLILGGRRVVATLGLRDAVVIDTPDALLVTTRAASARMKEVVEELARRGLRRVL